jgi:hypothetical protein
MGGSDRRAHIVKLGLAKMVNSFDVQSAVPFEVFLQGTILV